MTIHKRPVRDYVTPLPQTIGVDQSIASATQRMWQLGVRHLPVLDGDTLVGIVTERDLAFVKSFSVDPERSSVEEAMTPEPYVVGPEMPLSVVARNMAERKVGCACVVDGQKVVGILTTTDALGILADVLTGREVLESKDRLPSAVRDRILDEHRVLRRMLGEAVELADAVLEGDDEARARLFESSRELYQTLLRHVDLEDAILAPVLRETDVYDGPVRADELEKEHVEQRQELREALAAVETEGASGLARSIKEFVPRVMKGMVHEEQSLLTEAVLKDDPIHIDFFTG